MMKKLGFAVLTAAAVTGMTVTAFAGTWQDTADGWKYKNDDGTYKKNEVFYDETDGEYYLFDTNGIMVTGDITSNGVSYFFREDGSMARNTYFSDTKEVATEDGSIVKAGTDTFVVGEVVTFHADGDVIYVTVANFSGKPITVQAYDSETDTLGKEFVLNPMDQMRIPFIAEDFHKADFKDKKVEAKTHFTMEETGYYLSMPVKEDVEGQGLLMKAVQ